MSDPVLTSSYCTAWDSFNTPRLWSMVKDEGDGIAREQVQAWRRLAGSIRSQHEALTTAKADLVAAWPPEDNASAEAFVNELDALRVRLEAAAVDADTTANGMDRILNALDTAKKAIEPLWEKYKDKSDDLVPRWFDSAEDEIDEQARNHMITMENAVSDAVADLRVPDRYDFRVDGPQEWPPRTGPGEGGGSTRLGPGGVGTTVPHDPVPPLPGRDAIVPDAPGSGTPGAGEVPSAPGGGGSGVGVGVGAGVVPGGPDLAGVINPSTPPPGVGEAGPLPVGGPLPGGGPVTGTPPLVPGLLPGGGPVAGGGAGRPPLSGTGRGPNAGRTTLPSGAVIGGPGSIGGPGGVGGRGVGGPGAGGVGRGGQGVRPGAGSLDGEGRGGVGRGAGGPQLGGVGGPAAGGGRGVAGPRGLGAARGRSGGRRGSGDDRDEAGVIRPGAGDVEAFGAPAGGTIGGPVGGRPGGGRAGGGRSGARPAPRPAWLPDDPVGPDRHNLGAAGAGGRGGARSRQGDDPTGFDPDNLWQVAEGVAPVIRPGTDDDRHDPGPNVIGRRG